LLGAEFDKIISILIVTIVLTVAIVRARSLLFKSVSEQAAAGALARFFSPEIAERIRRSGHEIRAGQGQLRDAAILMTDIRGFTALATSMAPNEVIALLLEYEKRVVPVIQRHGGVVDKFIGDGILATFGCVEPRETYAADALRAAQEIMSVSLAWARERAALGKVELSVGLAVTSSRVVFGAIGDPTRLEFTVIGDAVNLAAKLEKHTKVEGVLALTTLNTYGLALHQGFAPGHPFETRSNRTVAGVTHPLGVVVID
jgi:adenylate cyclase